MVSLLFILSILNFIAQAFFNLLYAEFAASLQINVFFTLLLFLANIYWIWKGNSKALTLNSALVLNTLSFALYLWKYF